MSVIYTVCVAVLALLFLPAAWTVFWLFRYIAIGADDSRADLDRLGPRVGGFIRYVLGQARVIREFGGFLHFFIFWGFLVLQAETIEYFIRGAIPGFRFADIVGETAYGGLMLLQDVFGFLVLIALVAAAIRRFVVRPDHVMPSVDAAVIIGFIIGLMITKFLAHGAEIAHASSPADLGWVYAWTPFATATSYMFGGPGQATDAGWLVPFAMVNFILHLTIVVLFANYIPRGKHLHLLGAMPNIFFRKLEPRGALYPIDFEDEDAESFGVGKIEDLSWKQLLDTYACTDCGRCEAYCPAFTTGKELNPMQIIHKLKDHIKEKGDGLYRIDPKKMLSDPKGELAKLRGPVGDEDAMPALVGGVISREELMACTTCGACVSNCPVLIEHVDTIIDMRRYLILTEGDVDPELSRTFRNIENNSNPWGVANSTRGDWAEGLNIPLMSELQHVPEYLFFVGCAGSFDERQKKVTKAMAKILRIAGIDHAILGPEEGCTGDPARRIGNEYLYATVAQQNVETMNRYAVTKIITTCPHCFHTIGKEYPQLGGHYEVVHHTKLINDLLRSGRIRMSNDKGARRVTYHDSCYIGRWNSDYDNPREALAQVPGLDMTEMSWNKRQALCCGAGGGRMWMEEHEGKRVNQQRADMALETGADAVVVNCPFCMTMLSDGINQRDADMAQIDLAELVAESIMEDAIAQFRQAAGPAE
jgi:Fe-S oxidoreductase